MAQVLKADTTPSDKLDLEELKRVGDIETKAPQSEPETPQFAKKG
jgi:hypothetical protein